MWNIILQGSESSHLYSFVIPEKCISASVPPCDMQGILGGENSMEPTYSTPQSKTSSSHAPALEEHSSTTSTLYNLNKRKGKSPMVETEVRRSTKLQEISEGFKKKTCDNKNCMACHSHPPPIAAKIVKTCPLPFARWMLRK